MDETNPPLPLLSIVLVVGRQRKRGEEALACLLSQEGIQKAEVLLMDQCRAELPPIAGSDHPCVRVIGDLDDLSMGEIRAVGARLARGRAVAYLEEHARALPGWVEAHVKAFQNGWAGVGGEVHNPNSGNGISDTLAMMNYPAWRPPAKEGESDLLPGHNSAYLREVLLSFGDRLGDLLLNEVLLQWELKQQGYKLGIEAEIKFAHINETTLASLARGYYFWHRCFAYSRARHYKWNVFQIALRALSAPLIPFVRSGKLLVFLLKERPADLGLFFHNLPIILVANSFSAMGMAVGYLFGSGNAATHLTRYELEEERTAV